MTVGLAPGDTAVAARDRWIKDVHFFKDMCIDPAHPRNGDPTGDNCNGGGPGGFDAG